MTTINSVHVYDVRFPTAAAGDGSDAINRGDYSATYVELTTDDPQTRAEALGDAATYGMTARSLVLLVAAT